MIVNHIAEIELNIKEIVSNLCKDAKNEIFWDILTDVLLIGDITEEAIIKKIKDVKAGIY